MYASIELLKIGIHYGTLNYISINLIFVVFLYRSLAAIANQAIYDYERGVYLNQEGQPQIRSLQNVFSSKPVLFVVAKV